MDPGQRARYLRKRRHRNSVLLREIRQEKVLADWRLYGERGTCSGCNKRGNQCIPPQADNKLRTKCVACSKRGRDCSLGEILFKEDYIPMATRDALGIVTGGAPSSWAVTQERSVWQVAQATCQKLRREGLHGEPRLGVPCRGPTVSAGVDGGFARTPVVRC
jgi:hypothetical protein